ncbi:hypothetical protein HanLR1_Chr10g0376011 [Helianthus annuus]|nr:hypothetical protein HanHA89_Chr10g0398691 [Helianthus annuus]KAJ0698064.1 hypothetical protein HanLR1_Chr10g0376011 [Helianthus annuus]
MCVRLHAPSRRMDYRHACLCLGSWVLLYYVTCFIAICCHVCLVSVMICLYVYMHLVMFTICYLFSISFGIQVI